MPYLRLYSPDLSITEKRTIAQTLTDAVATTLSHVERDWVAIHFLPFRPADLAIGGQLIEDGRAPQVHLEVSAPNLTPKDKYNLVHTLMPLLMRHLHIDHESRHRVSIEFADYAETDFAIGGRFLNEFPARHRMTAGKLAAIAATITAGLWLGRRVRVAA
jgi:phenylpyruvate tautomerase PptA (4-oxalocrotonate tautomerase family)